MGGWVLVEAQHEVDALHGEAQHLAEAALHVPNYRRFGQTALLGSVAGPTHASTRQTRHNSAVTQGIAEWRLPQLCCNSTRARAPLTVVTPPPLYSLFIIHYYSLLSGAARTDRPRLGAWGALPTCRQMQWRHATAERALPRGKLQPGTGVGTRVSEQLVPLPLPLLLLRECMCVRACVGGTVGIVVVEDSVGIVDDPQVPCGRGNWRRRGVTVGSRRGVGGRGGGGGRAAC